MNEPLPLIVTGAAGFVGARFVEACNHRGIPVISVDSPPHFTERAEHRGVDFGRVIDREDFVEWLGRERPKVAGIVHLGACSDTMQYDVEYLRRANLEYSKSLWTWCADARVPFVYASSAATYGDGSLGFDDDESLIPRLRALNPYGESKRLFDLWALEEERRGRTPPAWSGWKFFNVYGFGERHKTKMASLVVHAFDQIRKTGQVRLFQSHREGIAHGHQSRDFVYVADVVDVLFFALDKPVRRGILNLGTGRARTFLDLARATFRAMGRPEKIEFIPTPEVMRDRYQYFTEARMERLRAEGYTKPFTPLEDGVAEYVKRLQAAAASA